MHQWRGKELWLFLSTKAGIVLLASMYLKVEFLKILGTGPYNTTCIIPCIARVTNLFGLRGQNHYTLLFLGPDAGNTKPCDGNRQNSIRFSNVKQEKRERFIHSTVFFFGDSSKLDSCTLLGSSFWIVILEINNSCFLFDYSLNIRTF